MRLFRPIPKTFLAAAVGLILLAVVAVCRFSTAPRLESASTAQFPSSTDVPSSTDAPVKQGSALDDPALADAMVPVESQDRRWGRKHALEDPSPCPMVVADVGDGRWTFDEPPLTSWVATLTSAGKPCSVLCCFLR